MAYMTPERIAERLSCDVSTVLEWELPWERLDGGLRISQPEVEKFLSHVKPHLVAEWIGAKAAVRKKDRKRVSVVQRKGGGQKLAIQPPKPKKRHRKKIATRQ